MLSRSILILGGAAAMALGAAVGCEREVAREEHIERRNGYVEERREVETVDPLRDEQIRREEREVVEPRE